MGIVKWRDIETFYGKEWGKLLKEFHVDGRMSSYEIAEKISRDIGVEYSYRQIQRWLKKNGLLRSHAESLKHRVLTGRMDYSKRKPSYGGININTDELLRQRGFKWAIGLSLRLRHRGDATRLARNLGLRPSCVTSWQHLRQRVSVEYQDRICAYFGVSNSNMFSDIKTMDIPRLRKGHRKQNSRKWLRGRGYKYATNLEEIIYQHGITNRDLADKLHKPYASILRWSKGNTLVSPTEQARIEYILKIPAKDIFTRNRR